MYCASALLAERRRRKTKTFKIVSVPTAAGLGREALKAIIEAKWAGDEALAWQIYQHWLPLMVFEQQCAPRPQHPLLPAMLRAWKHAGLGNEPALS